MKTKEEILKSQENAMNINITHYLSEDGYVWKMILKAMQEYTDQFLNAGEVNVLLPTETAEQYYKKFYHMDEQGELTNSDIEIVQCMNGFAKLFKSSPTTKQQGGDKEGARTF